MGSEAEHVILISIFHVMSPNPISHPPPFSQPQHLRYRDVKVEVDSGLDPSTSYCIARSSPFL